MKFWAWMRLPQQSSCLQNWGKWRAPKHAANSFIVIQSLSCVWLFAESDTWNVACQASLSFIVSQSLLKCPLSQWCYLTISSSAALFFFCLQSFPASGSFPMSHSSHHGASASASVLPIRIQGWVPLVLTGLISLQSKELSRVFSSIIVRKH